MKSLKTLVLALALVFAFGSQSFAKTESLEIATNMHCGSCKTKIENSLKTMNGIEKSEINLEAKTVKLSYNSDKVSKDAIVKNIADLGFTANVVAADAKEMKVGASCSTDKKDAKSCSTESKDAKSCSTEKKDGKSCCTTDSKK